MAAPPRPILPTLPLEIIDRICGYLHDHTDVSNFRLVNRVLASVGLAYLAPKVSFALFQDSIDRLKEFSTHPVLRHRVHSIECYNYVLPVYRDFSDFMGHMPDSRLCTAPDPDDPSHRILIRIPFPVEDIPEKECKGDFRRYKKLFHDQLRVFGCKKTLQQVIDIFSGFTNLKHIEMNPYGKEVALQPLEAISTSCSIEPVPADSRDYDPDVYGFPGVEPLALLLHSAMIAQTRIQSLHISPLAFQFFDNFEESPIFRNHGLATLESVVFHIYALMGTRPLVADALPQDVARHSLAKGGVKTFLTAAPALKSIKLAFVTHERSYLVNFINILPTEHVWPGLTTLGFMGVSLDCSSFIKFLDSHNHSLEALGLNNCYLVPGPDQDEEDPELYWSPIFIFLCTNLSLKWLVLDDPFHVSWKNRYLEPPRFHTKMKVMNVDAKVGEVLNTLACSKNFDTYLDYHAKRDPGVDPANIKKCVIEDLVDVRQEDYTIPIDTEAMIVYDSYLEPFFRFKRQNGGKEPSIESMAEIISWGKI